MSDDLTTVLDVLEEPEDEFQVLMTDGGNPHHDDEEVDVDVDVEVDREYETSRTRRAPTREREISELKGLRELRELRDEHLDVLDDLRLKHRELKQMHLREIDDLMARYQNILADLDDREALRAEYEEVLDDHIGLLEDLADQENRGLWTKLGAGIAAIGLGLATAQAYYPTESVLDFYADAPEIYSQAPEMGLLTAGLPLIGLYSLSKAYDSHKRYSELRDEIEDYKVMKKDLKDP